MTMNIGGHVSLGRRPQQTVEEVARHGFRSMQIFASSPGAWKPPVIDAVRAQAFVESRDKHDIDPVFIHAIYLINLASEDSVLLQRAHLSLVRTLEAGSALGAKGVITHIGSHGGRGFEAVAGTVAERLLNIVDSATGDVELVLENSAGAGGIIGSDLSELSALIAGAGGHPRLKIALDTAHLCASGWDFSQEQEAARLVTMIEQSIGLERLVAVHCNDSKTPVGSRRDRHAVLGTGHIGREGFQHLVAQPELTRVPWILETPEIEHRPDELALLQDLYKLSRPAELAYAH